MNKTKKPMEEFFTSHLDNLTTSAIFMESRGEHVKSLDQGLRTRDLELSYAASVDATVKQIHAKLLVLQIDNRWLYVRRVNELDPLIERVADALKQFVEQRVKLRKYLIGEGAIGEAVQDPALSVFEVFCRRFELLMDLYVLTSKVELEMYLAMLRDVSSALSVTEINEKKVDELIGDLQLLYTKAMDGIEATKKLVGGSVRFPRGELA